VNLVNQPPFRTDAVKIADQQHADHQLGIDRWPTGVAVKGFKLVAERPEVQQPVNTAQKMIGGDVILDTEPVKQRFLNLLPTHHRLILQPA
jgi:hypothetical protein